MSKNYNLDKIIKSIHADKWLAISKDYKKIIAYSDNLLVLEKKVGKKQVVYMKTPPANIIFAFVVNL